MRKYKQNGMYLYEKKITILKLEMLSFLATKIHFFKQ